MDPPPPAPPTLHPRRSAALAAWLARFPPSSAIWTVLPHVAEAVALEEWGGVPDAVATALGLKKHVTPKAMRRTFQDLARAAEVKDIVTRAISGHATETMQHHYSTVAADEKKAAIAKVIDIARARGTLTRGGMHRGMQGPGTTNAAPQ